MPRYRKRPMGYPEPGAWCWERTQALPNKHPPEPLPDGQISPAELYEYIAHEGLGHCLYCFPSEKLRGLRLRKLWETAQAASTAILEYLEEEDMKQLPKKVNRRKIEAVDFGEDATDNLEI